VSGISTSFKSSVRLVKLTAILQGRIVSPRATDQSLREVRGQD
jgi:hypothetical protein